MYTNIHKILYDSMFYEKIHDLKNIANNNVILSKNDILNEIYNILLLKYCDSNNDIFSDLCKQQPNKLYNYIYKTNILKDKIFKKYHVYLNTNFNIDDSNILYKIVKYVDENIDDKFFDDYECIYKYQNSFLSKECFCIDDNIVDLIMNELKLSKKDLLLDMNMEFGKFAIKKKLNVYGFCRTENLDKITKYNLIMKNIDTSNIKYVDKLNDDSLYGSFDCVICNCFDVDKKYIDECIQFIRDKGKGVLIVNNNILYNNGVNKNSSSLSKTLSLTWEYKIRKKLIDEYDVCKIIYPNWKKDFCIILFNKNKKEQSYIDFCKFDIEENEYVEIKMIEKDEIIKKNYCLNFAAYDIANKIKYTDVNKFDFTQSKIIECKINSKNHDRLNYRNILMKVYELLNDKNLIKKNTIINIEFGKYTEKGYKYIEELDMSLQGTDSNMTIKEIINQCKKNKIKIHMKIIMNDGKEIII
ncbi:hypothetical protein BMW23_0176 [Bodo saltans virus]|uniref:Methyltransferase n=1 Tax=Bodo saltans virus TaxID=2024608 RepID=A0A2H4UTP0_9VIRU|nr:hypothetical protein QJ851_gp0171 [Bodo saltans virus]ATZ80234.1 hypothetical protein BMW23_0176 [Bodo saltans virus]